MAAHDLWLVFALVFFLAATFREVNTTVRLWGIHPGWLACACVDCFFLIR